MKDVGKHFTLLQKIGTLECGLDLFVNLYEYFN